MLPATAPCMHGVDLRQQGRRPFTAASRQQAHLRDCICSAEQRQGSANDAAAPTRRSMLTGMLTATAVQLLPFAQPAPAMAAAYVAPPAGDMVQGRLCIPLFGESVLELAIVLWPLVPTASIRYLLLWCCCTHGVTQRLASNR